MSDHNETPSEHRGRDLRPVLRGWYVLVPAAALLVGILLGALVVGVVGDNDQPEDPSREPTSPPTPTAAGTGVVVPDTCLETADTAEQMITTLRDGIGAIRQFQEDRIRALLDELEDLEARARRQAAACRDTSITDVPGTPTDSTPSPS
jgi:hypothetical protein